MKADALCLAVGAHLRPDWAERLELAGDVNLDAEVGEAFRPIFGDALDAELLGVLLTWGTAETVTLTPEQAEAHPLIGGWFSATLGAALGSVINAGALLHGLAAGAPKWSGLQVEEDDQGRKAGVLCIFFASEGVSVCAGAHYGAELGGVTTTTNIPGEALLRVGAEARRLSESANPRRGRRADWGKALH